jgi:hypothetical protein
MNQSTKNMNTKSQSILILQRLLNEADRMQAQSMRVTVPELRLINEALAATQLAQPEPVAAQAEPSKLPSWMEPQLPTELMDTLWEYMPPKQDHDPILNKVINVGHDWAELECVNTGSTTSVSFGWLMKAYVQYKEEPLAPGSV